MLCECGCGGTTTYYPTKKAKIGIPSGGGYARFVTGHHNKVEHPRGNAYLEEGEVRRIKKLLRTTRMNHGLIGRRFGVHKETIRSIAIGKTWKHIT